jgi:hypothetical protein
MPLSRQSSGQSSSPLSRQHSFPSISRQGSDDWSQYSAVTNDSTGTFKTKYEPQKSIHEDIARVFSRPIRNCPSRGHEIPEPMSPIKRGGAGFRPHTSGTSLPPCYSPIRPSARTRHLHTRATSPQMLRYGKNIPVDMIHIKFKYPLNSIAYEAPSALTTDICNAMLPSSAENILAESRFASVAPFTTKCFYQSMSAETQCDLAKRRITKRLKTPAYPVTQPLFALDYEKRGTKGATKRHVSKMYLM